MTKVTYRDENARRVFGGTSIQEVVEDAVSTGRSDVAFGMVDVAMSAVDDALDFADRVKHKGMAGHAQTSRLLVDVLHTVDHLAMGMEVVLLDNGLPLGTDAPEGTDPNLAELHARLSTLVELLPLWLASEKGRVEPQRATLDALVEKWMGQP